MFLNRIAVACKTSDKSEKNKKRPKIRQVVYALSPSIISFP